MPCRREASVWRHGTSHALPGRWGGTLARTKFISLTGRGARGGGRRINASPGLSEPFISQKKNLSWRSFPVTSAISFAPFFLRHLGRILASVKRRRQGSDHIKSATASTFNALLMIRSLLHILLVTIGVVLADNCTVKPLVLEIRVSHALRLSSQFQTCPRSDAATCRRTLPFFQKAWETTVESLSSSATNS